MYLLSFMKSEYLLKPVCTTKLLHKGSIARFTQQSCHSYLLLLLIQLFAAFDDKGRTVSLCVLKVQKLQVV